VIDPILGFAYALRAAAGSPAQVYRWREWQARNVGALDTADFWRQMADCADSPDWLQRACGYPLHGLDERGRAQS
jgi:hypothetical protein